MVPKLNKFAKMGYFLLAILHTKGIANEQKKGCKLRWANGNLIFKTSSVLLLHFQLHFFVCSWSFVLDYMP